MREPNAWQSGFPATMRNKNVIFVKGKNPRPTNLLELQQMMAADNELALVGPGDTNILRKRVEKFKKPGEFIFAVLPALLPTGYLSDDAHLSFAIDCTWKASGILGSTEQPPWKPPTPNFTVGWHSKLVSPYAFELSSRRANPCPGMYLPCFVVTLGLENDRRVLMKNTRLQSGAIMAHSLLQLKELAGSAESFFGVANVFSLDITNEGFQLSCFFATKTASAGAAYYGYQLGHWSLSNEAAYAEGKQALYNTFNWIATKGRGKILQDLALIEAKHHQVTNAIPQPLEAEHFRIERKRSTSPPPKDNAMLSSVKRGRPEQIADDEEMGAQPRKKPTTNTEPQSSTEMPISTKSRKRKPLPCMLTGGFPHQRWFTLSSHLDPYQSMEYGSF